MPRTLNAAIAPCDAPSARGRGGFEPEWSLNRAVIEPQVLVNKVGLSLSCLTRGAGGTEEILYNTLIHSPTPGQIPYGNMFRV